MRRLAFFASKNGSGMKAVGQAIVGGRLRGEIGLLITNNPGCGAERWAVQAGIPVAYTEGNPDEASVDKRCRDLLLGAGVDLIVLSGFLRRLGPLVLAEFSPNILNVHPALLPKYGGKGMYGAHVHKAVLAAGESVSGATVHVVDPNYDEGPIVAQREVAVAPDESLEGLTAKVMAAEQELLIEVLGRIETGALSLRG